MALRFKYKTIQRPKPLDPAAAPVVPIRLIGSTGGVRTNGLVDSGADCTAIFRDQAEAIGLAYHENAKKPVVGVGGELTAYISKVEVELRGPGEHQTFRLSLPIWVVDRDSGGHPILLGRAGFFNHFEITFKEKDKRVYLKPETTESKHPLRPNH